MKKKVRVKVYRKYDGHCAYCGCGLEYKMMQVDHVRPIFRNDTDKSLEDSGGGSHECKFYVNASTRVLPKPV